MTSDYGDIKQVGGEESGPADAMEHSGQTADSTVAGLEAGTDQRWSGGPRLGHVPQKGRIPPKLYRIGEVVAYSGASRQTIHNYTTMGLLRESSWTGGGHRLYDETVFMRLDLIAELKAKGRSLHEIREHFVGLDAGKEGTK